MKIKSIMAVTFWLALVVCLASPVSAQLTKLNVGYGAIGGGNLPAWVAKEAGIFEKNGLDARLIFFTGETTAIFALLSGDVPNTQVAGAPRRRSP